MSVNCQLVNCLPRNLEGSPTMELKNLTTFVNVAEQKSFTKAGEILGYSQSTISFQIRQLEQELGVPVFERINHTVSLTETGERLLKCAHNISAELDGFFNGEKSKRDLKGIVRVALADSLCIPLMGKVFPELHKVYPNVTLDCSTAGTPELLRRLNQNECDLIYAMDSMVYDAHYETLKVSQVETFLICAPEYPLAKENFVFTDELIEHPFLLTEKGMSYRRIFDEKLAEKGKEIVPVFVSGNTDLICDLVARGSGIALLPDYACQHMIENGELAVIKTDKELTPTVYAQLLRHKDKWISKPLSIVSEFLCDLSNVV